MKYGDYKNYLTWTVAETIKNDRKMLKAWTDCAKNTVADYSEKKAVKILAKMLEDDLICNIVTANKLSAELVKSAITDVDFDEIAKMLINI